MATRIKSIRGLEKAYEASSEEVRKYFEHIPNLLNNFPMDVCLAYVFSRLELGQNMALYAGIVRFHKADITVTKNAINTHHMSRKDFLGLYKIIFDFDLPQVAQADLNAAEKTRDKIMHGKDTSDDDIRNAIARVLNYAEAINRQLNGKKGFKPYGNLKGVIGRSKKLDRTTTRFLLKGIGFSIA